MNGEGRRISPESQARIEIGRAIHQITTCEGLKVGTEGTTVFVEYSLTDKVEVHTEVLKSGD